MLINVKYPLVFLASASFTYADWPSEFQAASLVKQLVEQETDASMITRLYDERLPEEYMGYPYGQVELIASDCTQEIGDAKSGSMLIFASPMTGTLNSVLNHENELSFDVRDTKSGRNLTNSMMRHRATLMGYLEMDLPSKPGPRENRTDPEYDAIAYCYFSKNPVAKSWEVVPIPGHGFHFYRFIPTQIHYVGGFGGSHYIGWLSLEKYQYAPSTPYCMDWGDSCAAIAQNSETLCCPVNKDNKFHDCCMNLEKSYNFDDEITTSSTTSSSTTTSTESTTTSTTASTTPSSAKCSFQYTS